MKIEHYSLSALGKPFSHVASVWADEIKTEDDCTLFLIDGRIVAIIRHDKCSWVKVKISCNA